MPPTNYYDLIKALPIVFFDSHQPVKYNALINNNQNIGDHVKQIVF